MKRWVIFIALVTMLFLGSSCCEDDKYALYYHFPLRYGNYWEMLHTWNHRNSNNEIVVESDTLRIWVEEAVESEDGELCSKVRYNYSSYPEIDCYEYLVNRPEGLYLLGFDCPEGYYNFPPFYKENESPVRGLFSHFAELPDTREGPWYDTPRLVIPDFCMNGYYWGLSYSWQTGVYYSMMKKAFVPTACGVLPCFIRYTEYWSDDYSNNIVYYDYFSDKGLAKHRHDKVYEIHENGEVIGTYNHFEELLLQDCSLN